MYSRAAIVISLVSFLGTAFAQDSKGWRKFGNSSGDQSYSLNQAADAQTSADNSGPAATPALSQVTLPAGTFIKIRINEKLSSDRNQPGDVFTATLVQPLVANGLVIARPGQNVAGRVSEAVTAKEGKGTSRLGLELTELSLVDGQQAPIRTQLIDYERGKHPGRDAGLVAGTTAAGAAIGAVAGGGFGAGVGALGGAMAGAIGVVATHARATEIQPETVLTFRTIDSLNVSTDRSSGAFQPVQSRDYQSQVQPRERRVAPPGPYYYGGLYGPYYDPFYYPYYYPYGAFYGPSFGVVIRGGGFRGRR